MTSDRYDVFLSYNSRDRAPAQELAERLSQDGLSVWIDSWRLLPGDSIPHSLQEGIDRSRVLVQLLSVNTVKSDWVAWERGGMLFADPLNTERVYIPVLLDDQIELPRVLRQYVHIDWSARDENEYRRLFRAINATVRTAPVPTPTQNQQLRVAQMRLYPEASHNIFRKLSDERRVGNDLLQAVTAIIDSLDFDTHTRLFIGPGTTTLKIFSYLLENRPEVLRTSRLLTTNALIASYLGQLKDPLEDSLEIVGDTLLHEYYSFYYNNAKETVVESDCLIVAAAGVQVRQQQIQLRTCWQEQVETVYQSCMRATKRAIIAVSAENFLGTEGNPFLYVEQMIDDVNASPQKTYNIIVGQPANGGAQRKFDAKVLAVSQLLGRPLRYFGATMWRIARRVSEQF